MDKTKQLKKKLAAENIRGLAIDIDETLSDTNPHWFEHMINFHRPKGMTKEEVIEKYRFVEDVPDWQTEEAKKYMEQTLHSNEFNEAIPLIEGANKAVKELNEIIPIAAYITARPATVRNGTIQWLKKHSFPEAELITRPEDIKIEDFNLNKNRWKAGVLNILYPEIRGIVDDNPILAHELGAINYQGTFYLYGKEGAEFEGHKNVIVCITWHEVLKSIKVASFEESRNQD